MLVIWAKSLWPWALKSCPKYSKSPNLVTLVKAHSLVRKAKSVHATTQQKFGSNLSALPCERNSNTTSSSNINNNNATHTLMTTANLYTYERPSQWPKHGCHTSIIWRAAGSRNGGKQTQKNNEIVIKESSAPASSLTSHAALLLYVVVQKWTVWAT